MVRANRNEHTGTVERCVPGIGEGHVLEDEERLEIKSVRDGPESTYNSEFMTLWRPQCKIEILTASGVFSVTLTPQLNAGVVVLTALFFGVVLIGWQQGPAFFQYPPGWGIVFGFTLGISVLGGIWYQIAGSEEIEVSPQRL